MMSYEDYDESVVYMNNTNESDMIMNIINKNNENKNELLWIAKLPITSLPEEICKLVHVKEMVVTDTYLEKIDFLPPNLVKLAIVNSLLDNVDCTILPKTLTHIEFTDNKIKSITNIDFLENLDTLMLEGNIIDDIVLPKALNVLVLKNNVLTKIDFIKNIKYLKKLDISRNDITKLTDLPDTIEYLNISNTNISTIYNLPKMLKEFIAINCILDEILCEFPENIVKIDFCCNSLSKIPNINPSIKWMDLSKNLLVELPRGFSHLQYLDISGNEHFNDDMCVRKQENEWKIFLEHKKIKNNFYSDCNNYLTRIHTLQNNRNRMFDDDIFANFYRRHNRFDLNDTTPQTVYKPVKYVKHKQTITL